MSRLKKLVLASHNPDKKKEMKVAFGWQGLIVLSLDNFPEVGDSRAGFVVRPNDSETASALMSLLDSADLRREMSENARRLVRSNYTWERIAEKMFTLYENVIAGNFRAIT